MLRFRLLTSSVVVLLLACGSEKPRNPSPPEFTQAFSNLPLPPDAEFVSRSGGAGALQILLRSPSGEAQLADYYRTLLSEGGWRLVSDIKGRDGVTAMYAEQDGPPLWVRIWPATDRKGTMVQLTGAALAKDSTAMPPKTDSTRGPRRS
jgi:hypothetical protein